MFLKNSSFILKTKFVFIDFFYLAKVQTFTAKAQNRIISNEETKRMIECVFSIIHYIKETDIPSVYLHLYNEVNL